MAQDRPLCRFCLDSRNMKKNPLISPCECKGSMKYVHENCLSRWRRINPARNSEQCLLCFHPYHSEYEEVIEILPDGHSFLVFLLRYPFVVCLSVNYIGFFHYSLSTSKDGMGLYYEQYQYIFQIVYCSFLFLQWKVKNRSAYWSLWNENHLSALVFFHALINLCIHSHMYSAVIPLNIVLGLYWKRHVEILQALNQL